MQLLEHGLWTTLLSLSYYLVIFDYTSEIVLLNGNVKLIDGGAQWELDRI